jgi:hypothetical protein
VPSVSAEWPPCSCVRQLTEVVRILPSDSTFYGKLQSDVCCASCGAISSAIDPMLDISLDLRSKAGVLIEGENSLAKSLAR